jgi:DNA helicase-2/ATP-dependent DNA helicase PcrA
VATRLTAEQQAVVQHQRGHARVIAVAGAGKTSTLTHFVLARLEEGLPARRILVLMYNKAAQQDFEHRLRSLAQDRAGDLPQIRTFHSLGLKIYQALVDQGALPPWQGKILSDSEIEGVIWRLLQQIADDDTRQDILSQRRKWVEPALSFIDLVKSGLAPAADVLETLDYPPECRIFTEMFYQFEDWRKQQQRISYADMLYDPVMCFRAHPELGDRFGGHMQWLLVDEYQDINEVQQALLHTLWGGRGHVMVIGDPDQTIYEFRGSRPEFIVERFAREFGDTTTYQLPHTFRYGHCLSLVANQLIHHNSERESVVGLSHESTPATQVRLHKAGNEAALCLRIIQDEMANHPPEQIAVIHRLWALSAPLELALLQADIPYQLDHSQSVLEAWQLRIFWLLLEISAGKFAEREPRSREESWLHILTTPFPKVRRAELEQMAKSLSGVTDNFADALMKVIPSSLSQWQKQQLEVRAQIISDAELKDPKAWRLLKDYVDLTDLEEGIRDNAFSAQQIDDRLQTIRAFMRYVKETDLTATEMLDHWRQLLRRVKEQRRQPPKGIVLTSAHKSKGREWEIVLIPGVNAQYFPYSPEGEFITPASIESERRLLYVSMTRARKQLHIMTPKTPDKPLRDCTDRELPSTFERELAVERAEAIVKAVEGGASSVEMSMKEGAIGTWLPQYLRHLGAENLKLTMAAQAPSLNVQTVTEPGGIIDRKFEQEQRLHHETLGSGTLIAEDEEYLKVRFDGERKVRKLARKVAIDMIRFL